jgi:pimeloyl-ACP methyl ester carboxylesterase
VPRPESNSDAVTAVVLIHGVGFGPDTLAPITRALAGRRQTIVMTRRGYGSRHHLAPGASVREHVDDLLDELDGRGIQRAVFAGMSGGATIALAMTLTHPERVSAAVAHEPAVGSFSPELAQLIATALSAGGQRLVRTLAGEQTWDALPAELVTTIEENQTLIERDARAFVEFEPRLPPTGAAAPLVCTVGERSSSVRRDVATRLSASTGGPMKVIRGCGHLPQFDAPEAFADVILEHAHLGEIEGSQKCQ